MSKVPHFVKPYLWSYNIEKLDLETNKQTIIHSVLNLGSEEATNWLRKTYSKEEIQEAISKSITSSWSPKSLNLWSLIFNSYPKRDTRF